MEAMTKLNVDGKEWKLVVSHSQPEIKNLSDLKQFSDEFNAPGRTFYDGDDPFFQAVDLWYGVTMDKEVCILTRDELDNH